LLEVVRTLRTSGGSPHLSDRGQHQANENSDDRENYYKLNERNTVPVATIDRSHGV
jgi:hypothetical protein